ncbi:hypothetical protein E1B28_002527 [Marasmius oreades]|uniref:Uncharacterized protein n=1 Tax=Marasmius oreades TaxID=181124 RepID=A0A9P7UN68_9AGAR|nr:uncharacterized protein E1B28_002527 [Marasmius oreades]KAG7086581.1 hypothetical protein E1B28_002527 [Marasmius oreades]
MFCSLFVTVGLALSVFGLAIEVEERAFEVTRTSNPATSTTSISVPTSTGPPNFNITSLGLNGSGCPPGSAYYILNSAFDPPIAADPFKFA